MIRREGKKSTFFILGFLVFANILAWFVVFDFSEAEIVKVSFFDVGQGDAIFIETPQGHQILIDGGPGSKILGKLSQVMPFYDRSLDLLILTHPEKDHMEGLVEVLEKYQVDYVLWTGILRDTPEFEEWQKALQQENTEVKIAKAGQRIIASKAVFEILYPFESLKGQTFEDSNNTSIIAKLSFGQSDFLFAGDIYTSAEKELVEKGVGLESEVLKIAHHGSKTSTSSEFLEKVLPEIAVIQLSTNNPYGHPHQEVLERLQKYEVEVLRTDENGDIEIVSDGNNLKVKTKN